MACSPFVKALEPLKTAGLTVEVDGRYVLVTDDGLDFSRDHDGLAGIRQFIQDTLDEYEQVCQELEDAADPAAKEPWEMSAEYQAAELPQEENVNLVEHMLSLMDRNTAADPPAREFAPTAPEKEHRLDQLALARELNGRLSNKETAQALENDLQDRGGIPDPVGFITQRKQEAAMSEVATIVTTEFRVTGVGYASGPFVRSFSEVEEAKSFARKCTVAALNAKYAATIKVVPFTTRRAV